MYLKIKELVFQLKCQGFLDSCSLIEFTILKKVVDTQNDVLLLESPSVKTSYSGIFRLPQMPGKITKIPYRIVLSSKPLKNEKASNWLN